MKKDNVENSYSRWIIVRHFHLVETTFLKPVCYENPGRYSRLASAFPVADPGKGPGPVVRRAKKQQQQKRPPPPYIL